MNDFLDAIKLATFSVHKEGYKFIFIFAIVALVATLITGSELIGTIGLVLTLWCVFFFRDPERVCPIEENVIVSPSDGIVTRVEFNAEAPEDLELGNKRFNKISIFLNVFDVHVNRVPVSGKISKISYKSGKFLSANAEEASSENERNSIIVKTTNQIEVIFVQVAGLVARRIVSDLREGEDVVTGQRYGIIRFGSRLDVYLPEEVEIKVLVGQKMTGGETVIARIN